MLLEFEGVEEREAWKGWGRGRWCGGLEEMENKWWACLRDCSIRTGWAVVMGFYKMQYFPLSWLGRLEKQRTAT